MSTDEVQLIITSGPVQFEALHQVSQHRRIHWYGPHKDGLPIARRSGAKTLMAVGRNEVCLRFSVDVDDVRYNHQTQPFPDVPVWACADRNLCLFYMHSTMYIRCGCLHCRTIHVSISTFRRGIGLIMLM